MTPSTHARAEAVPANPPSSIPLFHEGTRWQMALGQRAALEGVVAQLKPSLAIEIGTAAGEVAAPARTVRAVGRAVARRMPGWARVRRRAG